MLLELQQQPLFSYISKERKRWIKSPSKAKLNKAIALEIQPQRQTLVVIRKSMETQHKLKFKLPFGVDQIKIRKQQANLANQFIQQPCQKPNQSKCKIHNIGNTSNWY